MGDKDVGIRGVINHINKATQDMMARDRGILVHHRVHLNRTSHHRVLPLNRTKGHRKAIHLNSTTANHRVLDLNRHMVNNTSLSRIMVTSKILCLGRTLAQSTVSLSRLMAHLRLHLPNRVMVSNRTMVHQEVKEVLCQYAMALVDWITIRAELKIRLFLKLIKVVMHLGSRGPSKERIKTMAKPKVDILDKDQLEASGVELDLPLGRTTQITEISNSRPRNRGMYKGMKGTKHPRGGQELTKEEIKDFPRIQTL